MQDRRSIRPRFALRQAAGPANCLPQRLSSLSSSQARRNSRSSLLKEPSTSSAMQGSCCPPLRPHICQIECARLCPQHCRGMPGVGRQSRMMLESEGKIVICGKNGCVARLRVVVICCAVPRCPAAPAGLEGLLDQGPAGIHPLWWFPAMVNTTERGLLDDGSGLPKSAPAVCGRYGGQLPAPDWVASSQPHIAAASLCAPLPAITLPPALLPPHHPLSACPRPAATASAATASGVQVRCAWAAAPN